MTELSKNQKINKEYYDQLQAKVDSMDETQLLLENDKLISQYNASQQENQDKQQKIEILNAKLNDTEVTILKMQD